MYGDIRSTFAGDGKDITYAFRTAEARKKYDALSPNQRANYRFEAGTWNKKRIAAAAAAGYIAGDVGYRTISGGSAYRNHTGQRDIVGIPFI